MEGSSASLGWGGIKRSLQHPGPLHTIRGGGLDTCLCGRPGLREPWDPGPVFPRPVPRSLYLLGLWGHLQHRLRLARGPRGHASAAPRGPGGSPGISRGGAPGRAGGGWALSLRRPSGCPARGASQRARPCALRSRSGLLRRRDAHRTAVATLRVSGPSVPEQLSAVIANEMSCAPGRNQLFCYQVTGLEDHSEVGRKRCGKNGE